MKLAPILSLVILAIAKPPAPTPVAIVYSLTGTATLAAPARPLHRLDRLPPGAAVEVGPASRLALAFANGLRYELGEGSRIVIGKTDLVSRAGPDKALPRVPPFPILVAISEAEKPGARAGAVRIRGEEIEGLSPGDGAATLADATVLRFQLVDGAARYQVEVEDGRGNVVFQTSTESSWVRVPAGALAPDARCHWTVKALDRPGPVIQGEADFTTLSREAAAAYERLRAAVEETDDGRGLLEAIRSALGMAEIHGSQCLFSAPGLVIETVTPESAGFQAGLQPGDRLSSWCRTSGGEEECVARGDLRTPFDWWDLEQDAMQRGGIVLEGTRGSERLRWNLLPTSQGMTVAPLLLGALAESRRASRDREQAGDPASAGKELERAAALALQGRCPCEEIWFRYQAAQLRAQARQWPEVDADYRAALKRARALKATRLEPHLRMGWWWALLQRGDVGRSRRQLAGALRLVEDRPGLFPMLALLRLAFAAEWQDDLEGADRWSQRAYDLARREAPGSGAEASAANNLAAVKAMRGDLAQAELYMARTLAIQERLSPSSDGIVMNLWNYGQMLQARGDLAGAEAAFLRARKILEKTDPESERLAVTLKLLGDISDDRGDHAAAESLFRRQLALLEKIDPGGNSLRERVMDLGRLALLQRQAARAEELWQRALGIADSVNPAGPKTASCLVGLAAAVRLQGRNSEAERLLQRAMTIWQRINPDAVDTGAIHLQLGLLLMEEDGARAEAHLRAAIRIHEKYRRLLPESEHALARLQARRGETEEAAATYNAAIEALESQEARLGGAEESQWLYGSSLGDLYFEAAEHQIALERPQEAWRLVERGRARGFQELLAQRDLRFEGELSGPLYAERHRLAAEYDRVQAALGDWIPNQGAERMETLQGRLHDLRLEQAEVQERIRRASPRIGALEEPAAIDLPGARSALDPGTVLLTYSVGEDRSFLFVVEARGAPGPGLSVYPLAVGKADLEREVETFRNLLDRPGTELSALQQRGRHLYDLLVRPAEPVLAKADRWLISPDGPLHSLPFAALLSGERYLAESKPIHVVASAAVYRELKASGPETSSGAAMDILAVGDPLYPSAGSAPEPQVQAALRGGLHLEPLPATRSEVAEISSLFPGTRILLGREATEEAVKALAPQARRLHFACHGLLDERFPFNSALALSIPGHLEEGRDNGLLQAWEIFEDLRLDADLVTLSACDSGLGKEMGGEGLVGLVRAFQFAGARSVLASLWSVADDSTADLMKRFYGYLKAGKSKDEALRSAQVDLIRSQSFSHPYYWAAFQLTGDWK